MKQDIVDDWLQTLRVAGTVTVHPTEIPEPILYRLVGYAHALLSQDHVALDRDRSAGAALAAISLGVAVRKQNGPSKLKVRVKEILELESGVAIQLVVESMRRAGVYQVEWPAWGFCAMDEGIKFRVG